MAIDSYPCGPDELNATFGRIDIYIFDQLLRGRLTPGMRVLDAGCGSGRNAHYLLRAGADVHGVDIDEGSVEALRALADDLAPGLSPHNFVQGHLDDLPFDDDSFDAVICSAVLHFARDEVHFEAMMDEMWRVLRSGGVFFARLASTIGIERRVQPIQGRWHALPDGTERFLVDEAYLDGEADRLAARLLDPLKTTNVHNLRAMTTWVLEKP
jgi:tellurite methyltransferase